MSLTIARLRNRFHSREPLPAGRCEAWLGALAQADGDALTAGLAGPDEWLLIRRVPLALSWREDAAAGEVMQLWSRALRRALEQAAARPERGEVVRYGSRREALADLLFRSALGETARQWAWQGMGLIPRQDLAPAEAVQLGVRLLLREVELVWPVLHALVAGEAAVASLTAALHGLPAGAWQALLRASPRTAGYLEGLAPDDAAAPPAAPPDATAAESAPAALSAAEGLLEWAAARGHFAALHLDVLAVLAAALVWPAAGAPPALQQARLGGLRTALRARLPVVPRAPDPTATGRGAPPPVERAADLPALPDLPVQIEWLPTRWAGALFWLNRLSADDLLAWEAGEEAGECPTPLPQVLKALAAALGVPLDDAALRAFCGGQVPSGEAPAAACAWAAEQVERWAAWLDEAAPELPVPRLETVCRRPGRLRFEAGWIALHMPMDSVDTCIRRLGLDLDPGWLPWLACVLRFVYDE